MAISFSFIFPVSSVYLFLFCVRHRLLCLRFGCVALGLLLGADAGPYQTAPIVHHRLYHKSFDADKFSVTETKLLWKRFDNLKPNTQYVFYLVAISGRNDETSQPSEKIVVWTDPAVPPIVDVSAITSSRNTISKFSWQRFRISPTPKPVRCNNSHRPFIPTRSLPKAHRWPFCVWH